MFFLASASVHVGGRQPTHQNSTVAAEIHGGRAGALAPVIVLTILAHYLASRSILRDRNRAAAT